MSVRVVADAEFKASGMTLAELVEFVARAQAVGCNPTDVVKATTTIRGRVQQLCLVDPGAGRGR